jgi:hypothetical protein
MSMGVNSSGGVAAQPSAVHHTSIWLRQFQVSCGISAVEALRSAASVRKIKEILP